YVRIRKVGQANEAFGFYLAAKNAVERRGVDGTAFERLTPDGIIAYDQHPDIVALWLQSQRLQTQHHAHPTAAADALYTESLAAQIFGPLDAGSDDQFVGDSVVESGDDNEISALRDRRYDAACGPADLNVARQHTRQQNRPAAHVDNF